MKKYNRVVSFFGGLFLVMLVAHNILAARLYGGYYLAERIKNLRNNCERFAWARQLKESAIENAQPWVAIADEDLWAMVPGQDLPRCIDVTFNRLTTGPKFLGYLKCGNQISKFGNYPYNPGFGNKPWKLTCPSEGNGSKVFCGPVAFVRAYKGPTMVVRNATIPEDYAQGYAYDFEEGAAFRIANHQIWEN
ncbi:hypothetical protein AAE02nite_49170 [Adhaeribacter aerolatus]|uniref:Uncharacterized protein n=1 Tax=Adhaeribacter aerolatus TaxID=670289 RepID=A0A512B5L0_9BACT|nr:hypothetical protein [Adhaeribacter aerolatus]GEO07253.1 hypothetical protein AAE02nite_49170 [Adhaeribacter aerolatus]